MDRLSGRVAIVTGGARGIGRATCLALAREGARVVIADIDADGAATVAAEIEQAGGVALAVTTDIAHEESVEALVRDTTGRFGRLDILHNNAALTAPDSLSRDTVVTEMTVEVWDQTMAVNLRSQMLTCKHAIPHMLRTEDFLAAIDYRLPLPKDRPVGLYVSGGPSPVSPLGLKRDLLQIGVRARDVASGDRPGTRLTLAVDVSASMDRSGGLEMVRRALGELTQRMGPRDRVSLVVFNDDAYVMAENLGQKAPDQFLAAVDSRRTRRHRYCIYHQHVAPLRRRLLYR